MVAVRILQSTVLPFPVFEVLTLFRGVLRRPLLSLDRHGAPSNLRNIDVAGVELVRVLDLDVQGTFACETAVKQLFAEEPFENLALLGVAQLRVEFGVDAPLLSRELPQLRRCEDEIGSLRLRRGDGSVLEVSVSDSVGAASAAAAAATMGDSVERIGMVVCNVRGLMLKVSVDWIGVVVCNMRGLVLKISMNRIRVVICKVRSLVLEVSMDRIRMMICNVRSLMLCTSDDLTGTVIRHMRGLVLGASVDHFRVMVGRVFEVVVSLVWELHLTTSVALARGCGVVFFLLALQELVKHSGNELKEFGNLALVLAGPQPRFMRRCGRVDLHGRVRVDLHRRVDSLERRRGHQSRKIPLDHSLAKDGRPDALDSRRHPHIVRAVAFGHCKEWHLGHERLLRRHRHSWMRRPRCIARLDAFGDWNSERPLQWIGNSRGIEGHAGHGGNARWDMVVMVAVVHLGFSGRRDAPNTSGQGWHISGRDGNSDWVVRVLAIPSDQGWHTSRRDGNSEWVVRVFAIPNDQSWRI